MRAHSLAATNRLGVGRARETGGGGGAHVVGRGASGGGTRAGSGGLVRGVTLHNAFSTDFDAALPAPPHCAAELDAGNLLLAMGRRGADADPPARRVAAPLHEPAETEPEPAEVEPEPREEPRESRRAAAAAPRAGTKRAAAAAAPKDVAAAGSKRTRSGRAS
ncbi:hypothetical protein T492DRAFT_1074927 [Pavlovales sp. CCMP2436]|nr:hypothetical protein T492DRAFT_1074927 [Pavlovales sp. CCMP2436]